MAHLGPHREVRGRESWRSRVWGSAFMEVEGWGLGFCVLSFLVNLKQVSGTVECWKRKNKRPKRLTKISNTKSFRGEAIWPFM